jgi:hypothetical protein
MNILYANFALSNYLFNPKRGGALNANVIIQRMTLLRIVSRSGAGVTAFREDARLNAMAATTKME